MSVHITMSLAAMCNPFCYVIQVALPCSLYSTSRSCDPSSVLYYPVVNLALLCNHTLLGVLVTPRVSYYPSYVHVVCMCDLYSCLCTYGSPCALYPSDHFSVPVCATGTFLSDIFSILFNIFYLILPYLPVIKFNAAAGWW